jgi:hypothetical protein
VLYLSLLLVQSKLSVAPVSWVAKRGMLQLQETRPTPVLIGGGHRNRFPIIGL